MKRWKNEDKEAVVKTLSERAGGMYVNCFIFVILFQIVEKVPLDLLSVGGPEGLSSVERPAISG